MTSPSENMSPLSPLSPAPSGSQGDLNFMLTSIPNLQDEEGNPLHHHHQDQQQHASNYAPPLKKAELKHGNVWEEGSYAGNAQLSYGATHWNPRESRLGDPSDLSGKRDSGEAASEHAPPPLPPPRNYSSQYRSNFHPSHSNAGMQGDPRHYFPGDSNQQHRTELEPDVPIVSRSNSTTTNQSLLDLADELGGELSSMSLHSSGRKSQDGPRWQECGEGKGGVTGDGGAEGGGRGRVRGGTQNKVRLNVFDVSTLYHMHILVVTSFTMH